ncbi:MAG: hypothetical protein M0C28_31545 [Candidatus Moduliflexus flocculans]|nr:hypothetical protein [Candidatus Moduliflexus flocculans]
MQNGGFMMGSMTRLKNRLIARVITRVPSLSRRGSSGHYKPWENQDVPWVYRPEAPGRHASWRLSPPLACTKEDQKAFDMHDKDGDPTYREIDAEALFKIS